MRKLVLLALSLAATLALAGLAPAQDPDYGYAGGGDYGSGSGSDTGSGSGSGSGTTGGQAGAGSTGKGELLTFRAALTTGQEVPKPKAARGAAGAFTATLAESGRLGKLTWKLTFKSMTGRAVAAHIHKGARGKAGGVMVPLCGPCRSGQSGTVSVRSDVENALQRGLAYVNVHTARNPAGEIRGQIRLVGTS
jgi:hypothetical protein